jgi:hypothetical protein
MIPGVKNMIQQQLNTKLFQDAEQYKSWALEKVKNWQKEQATANEFKNNSPIRSESDTQA